MVSFVCIDSVHKNACCYSSNYGCAGGSHSVCTSYYSCRLSDDHQAGHERGA